METGSARSAVLFWLFRHKSYLVVTTIQYFKKTHDVLLIHNNLSSILCDFNTRCTAGFNQMLLVYSGYFLL